MDVNKDQLIAAVREVRKTRRRRDAAVLEHNEAVKKLKTVAASSRSNDVEILDEAMVRLGEMHLADIEKDL